MTEPRPRGRPATGVTPLRNVRVPAELWESATKAALARGYPSLSSYIRRCLTELTVEDGET